MTPPESEPRTRPGLVRFAMANKKWWLLPMLVVTVLLVASIVLTATPLSPFIYNLF